VSLLELRGLGARSLQQSLSLALDEGELVALVGLAGSGKTAALQAVCGAVPTHGSVLVDGDRVVPHTPERLAREGVVHVPDDRGTLGSLSVLDNLRVGAWVRRGTSARDLARVFERFPELYELRSRRARTLADSEQELLALGRAQMAHVRVLLVDEPSAGGLAKLRALVADGVAALVTCERAPVGARVFELAGP
jgi:branched-chain amino acid transport system ATP-binding protein